MEAVTAPLHKNRKSTLARIRRFLAQEEHFSTNSTNQIIMKSHDSLHSQIYSASLPVQLSVYKIDGTDTVSELIKNGRKTPFTPAQVGDSFGPTWSTHLFKVKIQVPSDWTGKCIHFRWNSSSEAMLWDGMGNVLQGFVPKHRESYEISKCWKPNKTNKEMEFFIEMACNGLFGALGEGFSIDPPNPNLQYQLKLAEIAVFEPLKFQLFIDLEVLLGIAEEMPNDIRGYQALHTGNQMINLIISKDLESARKLSLKYFSEGNGVKAHTLVAMGHCHIDTAWLWTYKETRRKCARSWVSQLQLFKSYPDIVFTCSQMQQLAWLKEDHPNLFEGIKDYAAAERFIPVGGTWVEMDGLLPDGESFIRQFLYGQKFLEKEFGLRAKEFWLPDTFGYSGQIPQIMNIMGIKRFLTQKISWNRVNKFPHHNFRWEGIDGSEVLVHFPPGDSYEMNGFPKELLKSVNNSEDKGRTNVGAYLYGLGDGGGGPTVSIVERLIRLKDVDGLPKVEFQGPHYLFQKLEADSKNLCKWTGELYLEMHNGTYTSQAKIKAWNRKLEMLLKHVEFFTTFCKIDGNDVTEKILERLHLLEKLWKDLLLNQFHDVIPGSCIENVANDAIEIYNNIYKQLTSAIGLNQLPFPPDFSFPVGELNGAIFNPLPWAVTCLVALPSLPPCQIEEFAQDVTIFTQSTEPAISPLVLMKLHPSGYTTINPVPLQEIIHPVEYSKLNETTGQFSNGLIRLEFSLIGPPKEKLFHIINGVEWEVFNDFKKTNTDPGMLYIYDDSPASWDAWDCDDYHLETRQSIVDYNDGDKGVIEVIYEGPLFAAYRWITSPKSSKTGKPLKLTRYTVLEANSPIVEYQVDVDWKGQSHKFFKAEFPANVLSREATYEIQYGHIKRPTHSNTSWDMAQYEVSGHKWVDISQRDRGVSLINDSKYGFRIKENIISLSLLRSPKAPDENCDMHEHSIRYGILPHSGSFQEGGTIRKAYEFNTEFFCFKNENLEHPLLPHNIISTSNEAVIAEVVKFSHDHDSKKICLRLYESFGGGWTDVKVKMRYPVTTVVECDGMEEPIPGKTYAVQQQDEILGDGEKPITFYTFNADFRPFEIKSFLLTLV